MTDTTTETTFCVDVFIYNPDASQCAGPVLWTLPAHETRRPMVQSKRKLDDGTVEHRFVWGDMVGAKVRTGMVRIPALLVRELYADARAVCEQIERRFYGTVH
jgi:hypothetical protein